MRKSKFNQQPYVSNKSRLMDGKLVFDDPDGFHRAFSEGFFFVKMPDNTDFSGLEKLANNFYKEKKADESDQDNIYRGYTGTSNGVFESDFFQNGYVNRENNQAETLHLERTVLEKYYPPGITDVSHVMASFTVDILKNVLRHLQIPEELWDQATSGCIKESGDFLLGVNHYRAEMEAPGTVAHKDSSLVTILYSLQPGLEALIHGQWIPLDPVPGYFTVNFGAVVDVLTKDLSTPAVASLHRVTRQYKTHEQQPDRFSVVLYLQPNFNDENAKVHTYKDGHLQFQQSYKDFLASLIQRYDEKEDIASFSSDALVTTHSQNPVILMPITKGRGVENNGEEVVLSYPQGKH